MHALRTPVLSLFVLPALVFSAGGHGAPRENLSDLKAAIVAYHDSGAWDRDMSKVTAQARAALLRARRTRKAAMVLDIDETALANWPEEKQTDFGYIPPMWNDWEHRGIAPANASVLNLFRFARKHGVAVFFITGRRETSREGTEKNLRNVGYVGYQALILRPASSRERSVVPYKSGARAQIERQGWHIVVNVGDQESDLRGGHADHRFKLPNPMYSIP
jgi:acid phosphatase